MRYIYDIKYGMFQVRENEISLRKWCGGTAQLRTVGALVLGIYHAQQFKQTDLAALRLKKFFWLLSTFCCASKTKNKQKSLKNNYCMSILNSTFCSGSLATSLVREHLSPFLGLLSEQSFVLRIQFIFCVPRLHIKGNIVNLQFPLHAFRRKIISGRKDAVAKMRPVTRKESGEVKKHFDQIERPPRRLYRV